MWAVQSREMPHAGRPVPPRGSEAACKHWSFGMRCTGSLWLLAAALALVLVLEMERGPGSGRPALDATAASPVAFSRNDVPTGLRTAELADNVQTSLARPLFAPSRVPFAIMATPPIAASLPRLTGVIVAPGAGLALFAPAEGKLVVVAEGGSLGDYLVRSISENQVVLSGPGGEHVLRTGIRQVTPHVIHARQEASAR